MKYRTMKERLLDLKARQAAGEYTLCPRCGQDTMKPDLYTNALSRVANIQVCDDCGLTEAKLAFMQAPTLLTQWAALQPNRPQSDFKALTGREAQLIIQKEQVSYLTDLYDTWLGRTPDTDLEALRLDAYEHCAGLTALWYEPFQASYDVADGKLLIRFRRADAGVEMAFDLLPK